MSSALIPGVAGQDGSYLPESLLARGYGLHAVIRRSSSFGTDRLNHNPHEPDVQPRWHYGDPTDGSKFARLVRKVRLAEIYNLATQSHVPVSFQYTGNVDGSGVVRLLEEIPLCQAEVRHLVK